MTNEEKLIHYKKLIKRRLISGPIILLGLFVLYSFISFFGIFIPSDTKYYTENLDSDCIAAIETDMGVALPTDVQISRTELLFTGTSSSDFKIRIISNYTRAQWEKYLSENDEYFTDDYFDKTFASCEDFSHKYGFSNGSNLEYRGFFDETKHYLLENGIELKGKVSPIVNFITVYFIPIVGIIFCIFPYATIKYFATKRKIR